MLPPSARSDRRPRSAAAQRVTVAVLVAVHIAAAVLAWGRLDPGHDWGDDFASYFMQARSLWELSPAAFVAENRITIEESWERFHKQRSLDVSAAAQSAAFSVSTATQSNAQLRSHKESYYAALREGLGDADRPGVAEYLADLFPPERNGEKPGDAMASVRRGQGSQKW